MQVWLPVAPIVPAVGGPEVEAKAKASFARAAVEGIHDGVVPKSSTEHPGVLCHFWPHKGGEEWVRYDWQEPMTVCGAQTFWFDDTGSGECRLPERWKIEYLDGNDWKAVEAQGAYPVELYKWCEIKFAPVTTKALRLAIKMQPRWSVDIHECKVVAAEED